MLPYCDRNIMALLAVNNKSFIILVTCHKGRMLFVCCQELRARKNQQHAQKQLGQSARSIFYISSKFGQGSQIEISFMQDQVATLNLIDILRLHLKIKFQIFLHYKIFHPAHFSPIVKEVNKGQNVNLTVSSISSTMHLNFQLIPVCHTQTSQVVVHLKIVP